METFQTKIDHVKNSFAFIQRAAVGEGPIEVDAAEQMAAIMGKRCFSIRLGSLMAQLHDR